MSDWRELVSKAAKATAAAMKAPEPDGPTEPEVWWDYARSAAAAFLRRSAPPEIQVFGPVFNPGEYAFFHGQAQYARMYGGDGAYSTTGMLALGSPAFTVGALAASGYVNHRRKVRAQREAMVQWRDHQAIGVIGTNQRLLLNIAQFGWMPVYFGTISEFYPDLTSWSLTMRFAGSSPVQLVGPVVPVTAVLTSVALAPERWHQDPRLAPLFG